MRKQLSRKECEMKTPTRTSISPADHVCPCLGSFCDLQLPEPVLRVPGRGEHHHDRDPREAHCVSPSILRVPSPPTFPIQHLQWHPLAFCFQVQLLLWDLLPSGYVLLHRVPALLQAGGYPMGSIDSTSLRGGWQVPSPLPCQGGFTSSLS